MLHRSHHRCIDRILMHSYPLFAIVSRAVIRSNQRDNRYQWLVASVLSATHDRPVREPRLPTRRVMTTRGLLLMAGDKPSVGSSHAQCAEQAMLADEPI